MISHSLKFIFIHIPKTSGNSLTLFLKDYLNNKVISVINFLGLNEGVKVMDEYKFRDIKHKKLEYYYSTYKNKVRNNKKIEIRDYYKFTIVRNPYDRILSYYFYFRGKTSKNFDTKNFSKKDFLHFINKDKFYQPQYAYILKNNKIDHGVHIIHYENLINELNNIEIFNMLDFNNLPKKNVSINSKKTHIDDLLDDELKNIIYEKYKLDFLIFNYKK